MLLEPFIGREHFFYGMTYVYRSLFYAGIVMPDLVILPLPTEACLDVFP